MEEKIKKQQERLELIKEKRICCFCGVELPKERKYTCKKCWGLK